MSWFSENGRIISGSPPVKVYTPLEERTEAIWSPASTLPKKNKTTEKKIISPKIYEIDYISSRCKTGYPSNHKKCLNDRKVCICECHK